MIQIRQALPKDAASIAKLINLAMLEITYQFIQKEDKEEADNFIAYFVGRQDNQYSYQNIWVMEEDGNIVGQISMYDGASLKALRQPVLNRIKTEYHNDYYPSDETQAGEIYIDTFGVDPIHQGKGFGKKLLQFAIDKVVKQEHKILGLLVDNDNPDAKRLYERLGFQVVNEIDIFGKKMEHMQYA